MNQGLREKRIEYRLSQAHEALLEADTLFQASLFRGAVNRAYYAMFYATLALSVLNGRVTSKHSGLIAFFDQEFVKPSIFPKELSKALHMAFDRRQSNDYGEIWAVDQIEAKNAIVEAQDYVANIARYIASIDLTAE